MDQVTPVGSGEGDEDELDDVGDAGQGPGASSLNGRSERSGETKLEAREKNGLSMNSSLPARDRNNSGGQTDSGNLDSSGGKKHSRDPVSPKASDHVAATTVTPYVTAAHPITVIKHSVTKTATLRTLPPTKPPKTTSTTTTSTAAAATTPATTTKIPATTTTTTTTTKIPATTTTATKKIPATTTTKTAVVKNANNVPAFVNVTNNNDRVTSLEENEDNKPIENNNKNDNNNANSNNNNNNSNNETTDKDVRKIIHPIEKEKEDEEEEEEGDIKASAGENQVITLPLNHVHLVASTRPVEGDLRFRWTLLTHPKGARPEMMGESSKILDLTDLDIPGLYAVKFEVKRNGGQKTGVGFVNVTVHPRINKPPTPDIETADRIIKLPTNTAALDASKSSDDVGIDSYKWELVSGPKTEASIFDSPPGSRILRLKDLSAGKYRVRLTVNDTDGATDVTETTVTVREDDDHPPVASAGSDVIIRLPNDTVTLNGNGSRDDVGILKYEWTQQPDSPPCEMSGERTAYLHLTHLQNGLYIFVLKVTDTSGKTNEDRVMVTVLPPVKTHKTPAPTPAEPLVAVAGADKELDFPNDSTMLDGSKSTSASGIVSYRWEQVSGPEQAKLTGATRKRVHLLGLSPGTYVMKLTITDTAGTEGTDTVRVHVKGPPPEARRSKISHDNAGGKPSRDENKIGGSAGERKTNPGGPLIANAGGGQTVYLPTRSVVLDGSGSRGDDVIEQYMWVRAGSSPAAGVVINGTWLFILIFIILVEMICLDSLFLNPSQP